MGFKRHVERAGSAAVLLLAVLVCTVEAQEKPQASTGVPETLTLAQVIARATANEPAFAAAVAEQKVAALERKVAHTALLPTATYHNQAIYTQPNGVPASRIGQVTDAPSPIFIANNAVREYASQGVFDEKLGLAQVGAIHLADATAARAQAELEVARRGLVITVVSLFYGAGAGTGKVQIAQQALDEANHFVDITQKREAAREAAHADLLKAELAQQQRQRELRDAQVAADKARIELAVLLYPDPGTAFNLSPDETPVALPSRAEVQGLAARNNPELRSALADVQISHAGTYTARTALLPELALNFTYGIDATNFGVNGPDGIRNLGYSMGAQMDIPVWDWLATERKIKQAKIREGAARVALTAVQRRFLADLAEGYAEASAASQQLASLSASAVTARESLRLTNLRYVDGESTALEVVDAEGALIAAEDGEIDGRIRYELALASLQTLTGKL
jgi:outer membrane protein TolC